MNIDKSWRCLVWTAAFLTPAGLVSAAGAIKPAASAISFTFTQMNVPVKAVFRNFDGHIAYDDPAAASAEVKIAVNSIDLGDPEYNQEVLKKEWLDGTRFPTASFVSSASAPGPSGTIEVTGALTIKGTTMPVRFPVQVRTEGQRRVFEGALPISRLAFKLGEGQWQDVAVVKDQVMIHFRLVTE
jgi:polyisoprenoid-binding protein YceI